MAGSCTELEIAHLLMHEEGLQNALDVMEAPIGKGKLLNQGFLPLLPARKASLNQSINLP